MDAPREKVQRFKFVDFDLPFLIFVKDSLEDRSLRAWAEAYIAGTHPLPYSPYAPASEKPSSLILMGGIPVYVPLESAMGEHYDVTIPQTDLKVTLRLLRRVNPHRSTVLMGESPGDRTGRASFSSVRVIFEMATVALEHHQNFVPFCNAAVLAINHFIAHYRIVADRPYITSVTTAVIQHFQVTTEFEDGELLQQTYGASGGAMQGMGGSIPADQDNQLRIAVANATLPDLDKTLDANIRNFLDLKDWRLAVIESAVAFEAWISKHLKQVLRSKNATNDEIASVFKDNKGRPRAINDIAQNQIRKVTGYDFSNAPEYGLWATKVRDLRNDLVHGARFDVSEDEARGAYDAINNAMLVIANAR